MVELHIPVEKFHNIFKFCVDNNMNMSEVFTFNVKNKHYTVPKAYAILCSTILDKFYENKEISSFDIDIEDPNNLFQNIISLLQDETIVINNPKEYSFYFQVTSLLKIESIYQQLEKLFDKELEISNCINYLKCKHIFNFPINNEIDFISKNFSNFDSNDILSIDKELLIQILKNKYFLIKDEDEFFRLSVKIVQINENYKFMLDYVHYEKLSKTILNEPLFENLVFDSKIVKKLILINQETKMISKLNNEIIDKYIQSACDFLSNNEPNEEYQRTLINYCFCNNDINLTNNILNLKYFDYNIKYDFKTLLCFAIDKENIEIIKLLLNYSKIDVNQILIHFYNLEFIFIIFYSFL